MIFIVDDYPDGAEALCRLVSAQGYPCRWVASGQEALALIRAHPQEQPLLVLLDEMMPQMTGIEVLRAIRKDPQISHTAVIFYSAGFDLAKRDEAMTLGAAAWLLKGAQGDLQSLINTIVHWYEKVGGVANRNTSPQPKPAEPGKS